MAKKKRKERNFSSFLNNPIDFTLLITILLLLCIGLIMVLSASSPSALAESGNSYSYFSKQLIFAVLGITTILAGNERVFFLIFPTNTIIMSSDIKVDK